MQINQYPNESLVFQDNDFYDIDFFNGVGYETKKIKGSVIKAGILAAAVNIFNSDGILTANRTLNGANFDLFFNALGKFVLEATGTGVDNITNIVKSQSGFYSWAIKDSVTAIKLISVEDGVVWINEAYSLPILDGTAGQVLQTDGAGGVSWQTIAAGVNVYNSDGTLTANRTMSLGAFSFVVSNLLGGVTEFLGNSIKVNATGGGGSSYILNSSPSDVRQIAIQSGGLLRWSIRTNTSESGSNTGTNLNIQRYNDAGSFLGTAISINRATGAVTLSGQYTFPTLDGTAGQVLTTNGIGDLSWQTPIREKRIGQDYAYNMSGAGGYTWNGIANVGTTALVTLLERWRLQEFAGTGQPDGCYSNFLLPSSYVAGSSIKVDIATTENGTGGNVKYFVGLGKPTAGNAYGGELDTQWLSVIHTAAAGFIIDPLTVTFLGTNLAPGEPITVMIFRDPADAQDTYAGSSYINAISIEQV